jgi:hypothetical protein
LSNIQWTESKITYSLAEKTYYTDYNPAIFEDKKLYKMDAHQNLDSLRFYPVGSDIVSSLYFYNQETTYANGFNDTTNEFFIDRDPDLLLLLKGENALNVINSLPEMLKLTITNLNLESYDGEGTIKQDSAIAYIPTNLDYDGQEVLTYNPTQLIFIQIKSKKITYLDHLSFRINNEKEELIPSQIATSVVLVVQSPL